MSDITSAPNATTTPFDSIKQTRPDGSEFWSARDLMAAVNYDNWQNFHKALEKAMTSAEAQDVHIQNNFIASNKVSGTRGPAQLDYELSRFACYLTMMNGDPRKPEIAAAQGYFVIKTRQAEVAKPALTGPALYLAAIEQATTEIAALEARNKELEPKAQAFDGYIGAEGDYSLNGAAKLLQRRGVVTGQNRLRDQLLAWGWIYRGEKQVLRAKQAQIETKRLAEKTYYFIDDKTGEKRAGNTQVRITPKGVEDIHKRLTTPLKAVTA